MIEESKKLLEQNWSDEERVLIEKLLNNVKGYKSLMPKSLRMDITCMLQLAIHIKSDYDSLKKKIDELTKLLNIQEDKSEEVKELKEVLNESASVPKDEDDEIIVIDNLDP